MILSRDRHKEHGRRKDPKEEANANKEQVPLIARPFV